MGTFLPNTTAPDNYPSAPQLGGQSTPYERGQILIANNPVALTVFRGSSRAGITEDEYSYVTPSLIPLVRGQDEYIYGVKFKNAIPGNAAQVSGYLIEPGVAGLGAGSAFTQQVASSGTVTPGVGSVQIQKNGVLIGTEPILDFIDATGFTWALADDPANTRVTVTPPQPGVVQLADSLLAGSQASFDTNAILGGNIPQTYKHLRLILSLHTDGAAGTTGCRMLINNDSAADYYYTLIRNAATVVSGIEAYAQPSAYLGEIADDLSSSFFSSFVVDFPNYAGTVLKSWNVQSTTLYGGSAGHAYTHAGGGSWNLTNGITRLIVQPSAGNLKAGSRFTLYGHS